MKMQHNLSVACVVTAGEEDHAASSAHSFNSIDMQQVAACATDNSQDNDRIAAFLASPQLLREPDNDLDTAVPSTAADYTHCSQCTGGPATGDAYEYADNIEDRQAVCLLPDKPSDMPQHATKQKHIKRRKAATKQHKRRPNGQPKAQPKKASNRPPLIMSKCYADVLGCVQRNEDSVSIR